MERFRNLDYLENELDLYNKVRIKQVGSYGQIVLNMLSSDEESSVDLCGWACVDSTIVR